MLKQYCRLSDSQSDNFVGLKFINGEPIVIFPRGYRLSGDEKQVRKDIVRLLATLNRFSGRCEGEKTFNSIGEMNLSMPIQSYQYIIYDFLAHGYYTEKEVDYHINNKGKVNWKRTIQKITPQINNNNIVYLNFVTRKNKIKDNNIITKIHEYCVYESFTRFGWLFLSNDILPKKPSIKLNKKAFLIILKEALGNTFNDNKKMLFQSMINIISYVDENTNDKLNDSFGVNQFEYIWENMIDHIFGEENKEIYFPHANWHILQDKGYKKESSPLEPDTIIKFNNKYYIIDAKYYKYGITRNPMHLPTTSSIEKQIVYGEYIQQKFDIGDEKIYNAFILPFDSKGNNYPYEFVSVGTGNWNNHNRNYDFVLAILLDTRYIINTYSKHNVSEIERLTNLIEESLDNYLHNFEK
jgi:hypothetical protein